MKKVSLKLTFSVFFATTLFAGTIIAQTKLCAVKLNVIRNNSETKIIGAAANAVNTKTNRSYKSVLKNGLPYFVKLTEGTYRITVSKIGFKRSADDFYLNCAELQKESYDWSIKLYKGSSKQIVRLYNRPKQYVIGRTADISETIKSETTNSELPSTSGEQVVSSNPVPKNSDKVNGGIINGKAINLVKPPYPVAAKAVRASGAVNVQVTIDENGNVISAQAVSGHPLLRAAAVQAARASTFSPTLLMGQPVKVTGIIVYNFVP